jgi:hypothetical protein
MTELLEWIDVSLLPPRTRLVLEAVGPSLTSGLNHAETGRRLGRSEDWVTERVAELRKALAANALEAGGDELPAKLKARLEALVPPA